MYSGKEKCPGCRAPGTEKQRSTAKLLCPDCAEALRKGNQLKEDTGKYVKFTTQSILGDIWRVGLHHKEVPVRLSQAASTGHQFSLYSLSSGVEGFIRALDKSKAYEHNTVDEYYVGATGGHGYSQTYYLTVEDAAAFVTFHKEVCLFITAYETFVKSRHLNLLRALNNSEITPDQFIKEKSWL